MDLDFSEILDEFGKRGFDFYQGWTMDEPVVPERVQLPSGRILDRAELAKYNSNEAREGEDFFRLVDSLDLDDRCRRYSSSFRDEEDVENMRIKYPTA